MREHHSTHCSSEITPTHDADGIEPSLKRATCRVDVDDEPSGTGLLVDGAPFGLARYCILTAHHVFEMEENVSARRSAAVDGALRCGCSFLCDENAEAPRRTRGNKRARPEEGALTEVSVRLDPLAAFVGHRDDDETLGGIDYCMCAVHADDVPKLQDLTPVVLSDNHKDIRLNEPITVIGYPGGAARSFSTDKVRATNKMELQHAGPTTGGYSGGPCVNSAGDLIGLRVGGGSEGHLNYAMRTSVVVRDVMQQIRRPRAQCENGWQRSECKDCGGASICEHGLRRERCKDCGGSSICEHGRRRERCKDCAKQ